LRIKELEEEKKNTDKTDRVASWPWKRRETRRYCDVTLFRESIINCTG
jgi:hypothetical protein